MKKSKKRKSWLFAAAMIGIPAAIICILYPTLSKQAKQFAAEAAEDNWHMVNEDNIDALCKGIYVLYYEAMEEHSDKVLEPADILLKEELVKEIESETYYDNYEFMDEDHDVDETEEISDYETASIYVEDDSLLKEYQQNVNDLLFLWQSDFETVRQEIAYGVFDGDGNYLAGNCSGSIRRYLNKVYEEEYAVAFVVKFNRNGNLSIIQTDGTDDDYTVAYFKEQFEFYIDADVYELYYEEMAVPEDISIVYAISSDSMLVSQENMSEDYEDYLYGGYQSTDLDMWLVVLCAASLGIIFYLSYRGNPVAVYFGIKRMPSETILLLFPLFSLFCRIGVSRLLGTYEGNYYHSLARYISTRDMISILIGAYNLLTWLVFFAAIFLIAVSAGNAFQTGGRKWLRQNSLCYRLYRLLKKYLDHYAGLLRKTRLEDSQMKKRACQLLLLNGILCGLFCCLWLVGVIAVIIYTLVVMVMVLVWFASVERQYNELLDLTRKLAEGDLDLTYESMPGPFSTYHAELSKVQHGFKKAVEKEIASQKMKTELITNVSHDLKTPLTAIITYVNLLKEDSISEAERKQYVETLDKKAMRLKVLIEDLFEVSKAESRSVTMNYVDVNLPDLLRQVYVEYEYKFQEAGLEVRTSLPDELILDLDSQKTYRIFENLLNNCVKYAMKGTRVYIRCIETDTQVSILIRNISAEELADIIPEQLTERFIRGDQSRNTEGSGLGLAIARNFTELQGGHMDLDIDGDLFKVTVTFTRESRKEES